MRYRDCPTVEVEERIEGDPDEIWALVTDITFPVRHSPELQAVDWMDGATGVAVGNRFRGRNQNDDLGEWETDCTVIEVEAPHRWVWQVGGSDGPMATWGFEVDPGRGAVTVRQWARMGPARSGLSIAIDAMPDKEGRIVAGRMRQWRDAITANLAALRAEVEDV